MTNRVTASLSDNALKIWKKRYLEDGETIESRLWAVSGQNPKFYELMRGLRFLPNSPTIFNAGRNNGCTLSACFVFVVSDNMRDKDDPDSIHATRGKAIGVAKAGGGVGYYFGKLRPKGSRVSTTHRVACGPVAVMRDYQQISALITQGGKRDLAQMGVLNCDHADIREFIHCKDEDPQGLNSFNISVSWNDDALRHVFEDDSKGSNKWKELWDEQVSSAWSHGCPGVFFVDTVNRFNPNIHLGLIHAPNPCGETPNRNGEPCSLGSLALWRFVDVKTREMNYQELYDYAYQCNHLMDDILDRNEFPDESITRAALLTRKLGLGVMGWADTLALMGIQYDTDDAIRLADKIMKTISDATLQASCDLAKTKGPYAGFSDKTNGPFARNETRTSIAPTGTIALLSDCSSSIEPYFNRFWERTTKEGIKLAEGSGAHVKAHMNGFVPKTAMDIAPEWHVRHQAAFQKHTCLGTSKTINLPNSATKQDVSRVYRMMYEAGCKGGTIYRDNCRAEQVLVSKRTSGGVFTTGISERRKIAKSRPGRTWEFKVSGTKCFLTANTFEDGTLAEIFLRASKLGSAVGGMMDSWAISFSIALQSGVPLDRLCKSHCGTRFDPCGMTDDPEIPVCSSIPDYVCQRLEREFLRPRKEDSTKHDSGVFCPDCGKIAIYQSGCLSCPDTNCGWTRCG